MICNWISVFSQRYTGIGSSKHPNNAYFLGSNVTIPDFMLLMLSILFCVVNINCRIKAKESSEDF